MLGNLVVNPIPGVKLAMQEAAARSGLSREQIVDAMNGLAQVAGLKGRVLRVIRKTGDLMTPKGENLVLVQYLGET